MAGSVGPRSTSKDECNQQMQYRDFHHLKGHLSKYVSTGREKNAASFNVNQNAFEQTANLEKYKNVPPGSSLQGTLKLSPRRLRESLHTEIEVRSKEPL